MTWDTTAKASGGRDDARTDVTASPGKRTRTGPLPARRSTRPTSETPGDRDQARRTILALRSSDDGAGAASAAGVAALASLIDDPAEFYLAEAFIVAGSLDVEEGALERWLPVVLALPAPARRAYDLVLQRAGLGSLDAAARRAVGAARRALAIDTLTEERAAGAVTSPASVAALATLLAAGMNRLAIEAAVAAGRRALATDLGAAGVIPAPTDPAQLDEAYRRAMALRPPRARSTETAPGSPSAATDALRRLQTPVPRPTEQPSTPGPIGPGGVAVYRFTRTELAGVAPADLGVELGVRTIMKLGYPADVARGYVTAHSWVYREAYGRGSIIDAGELAARLKRDGFIDNKVPLEELARVRADLDRPADAVTTLASSEEQRQVRLLVDWIDQLTGTGAAASGDWPGLNALLVGALRALGRYTYVQAGITRILGDITGGVGLDRVADALRQVQRGQQRQGDALVGADSEVTIGARDNAARSTAAGIATPFAERLPLLLGENPEVVLPLLLGPEAQAAVTIITPVTAFLTSYGRGDDLVDSLRQAGWATVQTLIGVFTGRFGLAAAGAADVAATVAIGTWRGLSRREIEEQVALSVIQSLLAGARGATARGPRKVGSLARELVIEAQRNLPDAASLTREARRPSAEVDQPRSTPRSDQPVVPPIVDASVPARPTPPTRPTVDATTPTRPTVDATRPTRPTVDATTPTAKPDQRLAPCRASSWTH
ncbi:MAG: hypothetical protein R3B06_32680 [Kofleriaceae bacterium]